MTNEEPLGRRFQIFKTWDEGWLCLSIAGTECEVLLYRYPYGVGLRGEYFAMLKSASPTVHIQDDDWPRYYFDFTCAQNEILAWIHHRGLATAETKWDPIYVKSAASNHNATSGRKKKKKKKKSALQGQPKPETG